MESPTHPFRKANRLSAKPKSLGDEPVEPFGKDFVPHRKALKAYREAWDEPSGKALNVTAKAFWLKGKGEAPQRKDLLRHRANA